MGILDAEGRKVYCYVCMTPMDIGETVCPHCGYDRKTPIHTEDQLPACLLQGQYVVGKMLGRGGFGITYIGRDLYLDRVVAIKEYFPSGMAYRAQDGLTVGSYADVQGLSERFER